MTIKEVKDLIKLMNDTDLAELQFSNEEVDLKIRGKSYFSGKGAQIVSAAPMQIPQVASAPVDSAAPAVPAKQADTKEAQTEESASNLIEIKSPMVGTFYRSPSPDKDSYVQIGDSIKEGDVVCIIEAMKLFNEIESEVSGKIVKVLVDDASPVEYDQPLFLVDPKG